MLFHSIFIYWKHAMESEFARISEKNWENSHWLKDYKMFLIRCFS